MSHTWITTSSTTIPAMVNPVIAACERGIVPDHLYVLENPGVIDEVERAIDHWTTVVEAYVGKTPEIHVTTIEDELDFLEIHHHINDAIAEARDRDGTVSVDFTPGRKFMSAIAFTAGIRNDADHVFYFYLKDFEYYNLYYPMIPRTAATLIDFVGELK